MKTKYSLPLSLLVCCTHFATGQNLVVDGQITNANTNWGGGTAEAPYSTSTYENTYLTTGCSSNYVMEADNGSQPQQTVTGFTASVQYTITFRCAWRNTGCNSTANPTTLNVQFTDATGVLNWNISVPNTQTTMTTVSQVFTNNTSTSHTLRFSNPGNTNTCGVIIDDISIIRVASPGGVGTTNLSAWLNTSNLRLPDNNSIYGWISMGNNIFDLTPPCASPPIFRTGLATGTEIIANYNPYITFDGSSQYLQYITSKIALADVSSGGAGCSYFSVNQGGSSSQTIFAHQSSSNSRIYAQTGSLTFSLSTATGANNSASHTTLAENNILSYTGKSTGLTIRDQNGNSLNRSNGSANVDYITMGVRRNNSGTYSGYYDGSLSEIITFNTILNSTQAQQVRSYLASKYGVTLTDNSTTAGIDERNYLATNGTTTYWSYTSNATYHTNVTAIGRDDNTALNQKKSISTDPDVNSKTGNAMLTIDNGGDFSANVSYLAAGHNGISASLADFIDVPTPVKSRLKRIWKFQKTGTGVASSVTVTFDMTGYTPLTGSDLRLLVSTTSSFASASIISGSYSGTSFTALLPTTGGVYFTVGSVNTTQTPLPVELLNFTATLEGKEVALKWQTASELNCDYFTVEKTIDGSHYEWVQNVQGAGTSSSILNYGAIDEHPYYGISYYRLKQTDFDGHYAYSDLEKINNVTSDEFTFNVSLNQVEGTILNLNIYSPESSQFQITIFDISGKRCYTDEITSEAGFHTTQIDLPQPLSKGIYCITLQSGEILSSKKIAVK